MIFDLIIIGGGAAGLFAGANCTLPRTLLLEKMPEPGKKILISGGGMCNLTNCDSPGEFVKAFGSRSKENFLKPALSGLSPEKTVKWFEENGLPLETREDGKIFPRSLKARSVVDFLTARAREKGVDFRFSSAVERMENREGIFIITSGRDTFKSRYVLVSTGGKSFESTGSDGSGYPLVRSLGHSIIEPTQALVPLFIEEYELASLAGNSVRNCTVDFYRKGEKKRYLRDTGDLLFTHKGFSGPVILNNSRDVRGGDLLKICLAGEGNREELREKYAAGLMSPSGKNLKNFLKSMGIFSALADFLLLKAGIGEKILCGQLGKEDRNRLLSLILEYPAAVSRKGYFSSAMVTAGGVSLDEVDRKTMESKILPGLYFAGEVLDIDGNTGGYNIQAAFSTAYAALSSIEKKKAGPENSTI